MHNMMDLFNAVMEGDLKSISEMLNESYNAGCGDNHKEQGKPIHTEQQTSEDRTQTVQPDLFDS